MTQIPTWLYNLPKDAAINSREFASLLGISVSGLSSRLYDGYKGIPMPKPDFAGMRIKGNRKPKNYWRAVTVRNYIRQLNRLEVANERNAVEDN